MNCECENLINIFFVSICNDCNKVFEHLEATEFLIERYTGSNPKNNPGQDFILDEDNKII